MKAIILVTCTVLTAWPIVAVAHHNAASHYQLDKSIKVEGVVTKFEMINPHARLQFDVRTASGEVQRWLGEGNSHGVLARRGWTSEILKKGDQVKITGRPSRDGSPIILWTTITKADGSVLYGGNTIPTFSSEGVPQKTKDNFAEIRKRQQQERDRARKEAEAAK